MKLLLTAAAFALSVVALSGSSQASTLTIAEYTWPPGKKPGFYDSRLNSEESFAYFYQDVAYIHNIPHVTTYGLATSIESPYAFSSTDQVRFSYFIGPSGTSTYSYVHTMENGEVFSSQDPFDVVAEISRLSIFDFNSSFIYFTYGSGVEMKESLAQMITGDSALWFYGASLTFDTLDSSFHLNWSGSSMGYTITRITLAYTYPIPEPETWAMLLAGLGVVGAVTSRRRKGAAV